MGTGWRPMPHPLLNECPVCFISHFPFCNPNPGHTPGQCQRWTSFPTPDYLSSAAQGGGPTSYDWKRSPISNYTNGYEQRSFGERNTTHISGTENQDIYKRRRVHEIGHRFPSNMSTDGFSSDGERQRRLKLIWEHGGAPCESESVQGSSYFKGSEPHDWFRSTHCEEGPTNHNEYRSNAGASDSFASFVPIGENKQNMGHLPSGEKNMGHYNPYHRSNAMHSEWGNSTSCHGQKIQPFFAERYTSHVMRNEQGNLPQQHQGTTLSPRDSYQPLANSTEQTYSRQHAIASSLSYRPEIGHSFHPKENGSMGSVTLPGQGQFHAPIEPQRSFSAPAPIYHPPSQDFSLFPLACAPKHDMYTGNETPISRPDIIVQQEPKSSSMCQPKAYEECPPQKVGLNSPKVINASQLFKYPEHAFRPERIVIILRGLPGSGKSYTAKLIRDIEVQNGNPAPRIHSMDDYFMTEVEKVDESNSSCSTKGNKGIKKKVLEYCYEPEMEEAYRDSMLKAYKKTLEEGDYKIVIVDDRNLRVADFAQFWAIAKRIGFEVYVSEAAYKDPVGCAARNVHGFTAEEIQKMAASWEQTPTSCTLLDIKSLLLGDDLKDNEIKEVDMDSEDGDSAINTHDLPRDYLEKEMNPPAVKAAAFQEISKPRKSKWLDESDEDDDRECKETKNRDSYVQPVPLQSCGKEGKSVHWGDQSGNSGFCIGASKMSNIMSLVIGPGAGYNSKTNPLDEEEDDMVSATKSVSRSLFQERLQAEHASFRAVFNRRQRLDVLENTKGLETGC